MCDRPDPAQFVDEFMERLRHPQQTPLPGSIMCPAGTCSVPTIWGSILPPCPHFQSTTVVC